MSNKSTSPPALFLDRDGILNIDLQSYVKEWPAWQPKPGVTDMLRTASSLGFVFIIITNQAGLNRGIMPPSSFSEIRYQLRNWIWGITGQYPLEIYFCPHHPRLGRCLCRKPGTLWFERAIHRFRLEPHRSIMMGDQDRDLEPARQLGITTVLIGHADSPYAQWSFPNLMQASDRLGHLLAEYAQFSVTS